MQIFLLYHESQHAYMIRTAKMTHNHEMGTYEYNLYTTEWHSDATLQATTKMMLTHKAIQPAYQ